MNKHFASVEALQAAEVDPARDAAREVGRLARENAGELDFDGAFPEREIDELRRAGLLTAPLPRKVGGTELAGLRLADVLRRVGAGSLPLGRLYEGHVNALGLILRYGESAQIAAAAEAAREGQLYGVWNTDDARGLRLVRDGGSMRLQGRKILCSGAGHIARPLVTANDESGRRLMVLARLDGARRADLSSWTAQGMRASATGAVDFTGLAVSPGDIVGEDGDYERQPYFSAGAWRFCAVQLGGLEALLDLSRQHLVRTKRGDDPHQGARLAEAAIAVETAALWTRRAAELAEQDDGARAVAYVNLARLAVERAGLDLMQLVHRSVGLQGFMRPNAMERVTRDLATYLRQPGPDRAATSAAAYILADTEDAFGLWT